jgi:hypothetical protein
MWLQYENVSMVDRLAMSVATSLPYAGAFRSRQGGRPRKAQDAQVHYMYVQLHDSDVSNDALTFGSAEDWFANFQCVGGHPLPLLRSGPCSYSTVQDAEDDRRG